MRLCQDAVWVTEAEAPRSKALSCSPATCTCLQLLLLDCAVAAVPLLLPAAALIDSRVVPAHQPAASACPLPDAAVPGGARVPHERPRRRCGGRRCAAAEGAHHHACGAAAGGAGGDQGAWRISRGLLAANEASKHVWLLAAQHACCLTVSKKCYYRYRHQCLPSCMHQKSASSSSCVTLCRPLLLGMQCRAGGTPSGTASLLYNLPSPYSPLTALSTDSFTAASAWHAWPDRRSLITTASQQA
jgi:hypothetical protein